MDRLSLFLSLMTGAVLTGGFVIIAFTAGYYGWISVAISAVVGFSLAWPAAYAISRRIKRRDPGFDHTRAEPSATPNLSAREV